MISAEAYAGNNFNITPSLECTSSTAIGVLAAAQRQHNNQHQPKRLEVSFLLPFNGSPVLNAPPRYFYQTAVTLQANAPLITTSLLLSSFNLFHSQLSPLLLL
jgi:hypothetical protein